MTASPSSQPMSVAETARRVQITTGARLHFGLLDTVAPFGGCGVMIDGADTQISVLEAPVFEICGGQEARIARIAGRIEQHLGLRSPPKCRIEIHQSAPEHSGLGSGTQLSLAVAEGILRIIDETSCEPSTIIQMADRGRRSAVGVHGYFHGGFIAEGLQGRNAEAGTLNPMDERVEFPEQWCAVVMLPSSPVPAIAGELESECFSEVSAASTEARNQLMSQLEMEVLPAATAGRFADFVDAVAKYNHDSGMLFEQVQGGPYNGDPVWQLIREAQTIGGRGIGQSSWGPGVFAWFENPESAREFVARAPSGAKRCLITRVRNHPRQLTEFADS